MKTQSIKVLPVNLMSLKNQVKWTLLIGTSSRNITKKRLKQKEKIFKKMMMITKTVIKPLL